MPGRRRIEPVAGANAVREALVAVDAGTAPDRAGLTTAVRFLLEELAARAPGASVEVRVPPYGVTQCVAGTRHTRGTPPNVVEAEPLTWLLLATGRLDWTTAREGGRLSVSGNRADLSTYLPLV